MIRSSTPRRAPPRDLCSRFTAWMRSARLSRSTCTRTLPPPRSHVHLAVEHSSRVARAHRTTRFTWRLASPLWARMRPFVRSRRWRAATPAGVSMRMKSFSNPVSTRGSVSHRQHQRPRPGPHGTLPARARAQDRRHHRRGRASVARAVRPVTSPVQTEFPGSSANDSGRAYPAGRSSRSRTELHTPLLHVPPGLDRESRSDPVNLLGRRLSSSAPWT